MKRATGTLVPTVNLAPDYSIPRVVTGLWQLAKGHGGNRQSEEALMRRFAALVEAGFTAFDCADIYLGVESLLGHFLKSSGLQRQVQVHTKFVPDRSRLDALRAADVEEAIDRSLSRLGLERLDLVQFHWWDYGVAGYLDTLHALDRLRQKGKIRCLGVTNFDQRRLRELIATGIPVVSLQLQYSMLDRRAERGMAALCADRNIAMLAYGVLAGGLLTGGGQARQAATPGNRSQAKYGLMVEEAGGWDRVGSLLQCLERIALRHEATVASVAAAWTLTRPGVTSVILGCGSQVRTDEHLAMLKLRLEDRDLDEINVALTRLRNPPGDVFSLERDPTGPHSQIIKTELNAEAVSRQAGSV